MREFIDIMEILREDGFDAAFLYDFGFHSDFAQEPTYVVLNPHILEMKSVDHST